MIVCHVINLSSPIYRNPGQGFITYCYIHLLAPSKRSLRVRHLSLSLLVTCTHHRSSAVLYMPQPPFFSTFLNYSSFPFNLQKRKYIEKIPAIHCTQNIYKGNVTFQMSVSPFQTSWEWGLFKPFFFNLFYCDRILVQFFKVEFGVLPTFSYLCGIFPSSKSTEKRN